MGFGSKVCCGQSVESAHFSISDLRDLFPNEFMKEYTKFATFDDLLRALGQEPGGAVSEDLLASPAANELIVQSTEFISWQDMRHTAENYYILQHTKPVHLG